MCMYAYTSSLGGMSGVMVIIIGNELDEQSSNLSANALKAPPVFSYKDRLGFPCSLVNQKEKLWIQNRYLCIKKNVNKLKNKNLLTTEIEVPSLSMVVALYSTRRL